MSDTQAQEAVSAIREALETYAPQRPFGQQCPVRMALERVDEVSGLLRSQAARIAELERELARMREPLSDERIAECINKAKTSLFDRDGTTSFRIARAIEAAHGIKGDSK